MGDFFCGIKVSVVGDLYKRVTLRSYILYLYINNFAVSTLTL